ncbi:MAG: putative sulfate exporter family transporter, partial [Planctomycetes bacterium]|nr:putative sulfate exporter family transporter [Planctomycetota bacterium]
ACGEAASVVKLARVTCLLPLGLVLLAVVRRRGEAHGRVTVPWFVFGFALVAAANVSGLLPAALATLLAQSSTVLMTVAMAALGLGSSLREVLAGGRRPLLAAAATTTFVGITALLAARLAA